MKNCRCRYRNSKPYYFLSSASIFILTISNSPLRKTQVRRNSYFDLDQLPTLQFYGIFLIKQSIFFFLCIWKRSEKPTTGFYILKTGNFIERNGIVAKLVKTTISWIYFNTFSTIERNLCPKNICNSDTTMYS